MFTRHIHFARAAVFALLFALCGSAWAQAANDGACESAMVGNWSASDVATGLQFSINQKTNGEFELHGTMPGAPPFVSVGRWGCSNGLLAQWTLTVNGRAVDSTKDFTSDVYEVKPTSAQEWVFKEVRTGHVLVFRRLPAAGS